MKIDIDRVMTTGNGFLIQGVAWLMFWLFPAFHLFESDHRWGHNFALPIIFITVGLACNLKSLSCQLVAVFTSFLTVPTLLAFWPWNIATGITVTFFGLFILLFLIERTGRAELFNPKPRLKAWLVIHLLNFSYIGLAHMPLIFFLVRWFNPEPFTAYLPVEHHASTSIFNAMLFIMVILAILERYVKRRWVISLSKTGFIWALLMIVIPFMSIITLGE